MIVSKEKVFEKLKINQALSGTKNSAFSHGPSKGVPKDHGDNPSVLVLWGTDKCKFT